MSHYSPETLFLKYALAVWHTTETALLFTASPVAVLLQIRELLLLGLTLLLSLWPGPLSLLRLTQLVLQFSPETCAGRQHTSLAHTTQRSTSRVGWAVCLVYAWQKAAAEYRQWNVWPYVRSSLVLVQLTAAVASSRTLWAYEEGGCSTQLLWLLAARPGKLVITLFALPASSYQCSLSGTVTLRSGRARPEEQDIPPFLYERTTAAALCLRNKVNQIHPYKECFLTYIIY